MILQQYFCIPHNISRIDLVLATFTPLFTDLYLNKKYKRSSKQNRISSYVVNSRQ